MGNELSMSENEPEITIVQRDLVRRRSTVLHSAERQFLMSDCDNVPGSVDEFQQVTESRELINSSPSEEDITNCGVRAAEIDNVYIGEIEQTVNKSQVRNIRSPPGTQRNQHSSSIQLYSLPRLDLEENGDMCLMDNGDYEVTVGIEAKHRVQPKNCITENDCGLRGAYVDVSIFKHHSGSQIPTDSSQSFRINFRGAAFMGGLAQNETSSEVDKSNKLDIVEEYERLRGQPIDRHFIKDHRAKQLLVVQSDDKFVAVAAPEAFSRHSGTCMILGGQGAYSVGNNKSYELKVGSFLRIGSVGVVVCEIHTGGAGTHKCLSWEELTCLKGDISNIEKDFISAEALTCQEDTNQRADSKITEQKMCYMCFDYEIETSNPLVAPCECKGDTRYVHLKCLQQWHTTTSENKICVILNNKGVRVCTVCKSPYKASVRLLNGESVSLFTSPLPPPYICFMVVTKHHNNENLFSTKYQLSFSTVLNKSGTSSSRNLIVGRSRQCDMVLDYRTVSTRHASIKFLNGGFHFSDLMSSNGSYLYMREPLQLPFGDTVYIKWGSNVVSLKAKQSIRHRLSSFVGRKSSKSNVACTIANDFSILESLCDICRSPMDSSFSLHQNMAGVNDIRQFPESASNDAAAPH